MILVYTVNDYANDAMSIHFDTSYLDWNNTFPAISFCMLQSSDPNAIGTVLTFVPKYYDDHNITKPDD